MALFVIIEEVTTKPSGWGTSLFSVLNQPLSKRRFDIPLKFILKAIHP
jgi:hypothetical protein